LELDLSKVQEGSSIFKLAALRELNLKSCEKQQAIQLSTKYQVLSKHTAIVGIMKNREKSGEEMETIKCRVVPYKGEKT